MERRAALKSLGLTLGSLVSMPAWAKGWTPETLGYRSVLPMPDEQLLAEIVGAIIPATTFKGEASPSAKDLKVHQFAIRMIADCYDEMAMTTLKQGLSATDLAARQVFSKSFMELAQPERVKVFTILDTSTEGVGKPFINLIKSLTIQGFTNSEYYLTNVAGYNMAPGFYHGCVPVS